MPESTEVATADTATAIASIDERNPASIIQYAIDHGIQDVEVLERLVGLAERVSERNARAAFFEALTKFQEDVDEIPKSKTAQITTTGGSQFSYDFAPFEQITRTIREPLQKHGLSYSFTTDLEGDVLYVTCILRHVEGHVEVSRFPVPTKNRAGMSEAQKHGSALTYGRRQSLTAVLGLTASEDTDAAPNPEDMEPIAPQQVEQIEALVDESGADLERFLAFMEVERIPQITRGRFDDAIRALNRKKVAS